MRKIPWRGRSRGSVLLLSIFCLIVLFSLSVAFFRIIPAEYHSAANSRRQIQATYATDSGVRHAVTWLKHQWAQNSSHIISPDAVAAYNVANMGTDYPDGDVDWPTTLSTTDPRLVAHKVDDGWSYLSHIRMNDNAFFLRVYEIEVCSYFYGRQVSIAKVTVQNESFARFALFYAKWEQSMIYSMTPNGIQGPVHTNEFFRIAADDAGYWDATKVVDGTTVPEDPWVSGPLARMTQSGSFAYNSTSPTNTLGIAGDGIQYANGNSFKADLGLVPYTADGSPIADRYNKIVEGGRENISQVERIPLPTNNTDLREQAWGTTPPANNAGWNAVVGDAGTVLVNTDTGHPNDPAGKVSGGIFIRGSDANDVLLDVTEEGHQITRVRQGSVTVADPSRDSYRARFEIFEVPTHHPAREVPVYGNVNCRDVQVPNQVQRTYSEERTEANGSRCGYTTEYIPGEGGVNQPIQVPLVCTFTVTWTQWENDGTFRTERQCDWGPTGETRTEPAYTTWAPGDSSHPEARSAGFEWRTVDADYPGAEVVAGTRSIENWNSVVEVNDADYKIPFYSGMKINGEVITDPNDSRLTVPDGHTVTIKNDFARTDGSGNVIQDYAEYTVMEGRVNGVVFGDVHLKGVRGTAKGSKYDDGAGNIKYQGKVLAANIASGKDIELRDSVMQYYDGDDETLRDGAHNRLKPGKTSPDSKHILGIFAREIRLRPNSDAHNYENTDTAIREGGRFGGRAFRGGRFQGGFNVYAILMAGREDANGNPVGGFGVDDSAMTSSDRLGDFNLYGGIISGHAKQTQKTHGSTPHGFRLHLNYDQIAAEFLEYFPPTNAFTCLRYVTYSPKDVATLYR
jgi:hypothetical protein